MGAGDAMRILLAFLLILLTGVPARAQQSPPWWLHGSPLAGAVIAADPGHAPRAAVALQLEFSRIMPIGFGLAGGYAAAHADDLEGQASGPWAEALFVYRFALRVGGRVAPYIGPVAGVLWDGPLTRGHFGGRLGVDIPMGRRLPALRAEVSWRRFTEERGEGAAHLAKLMVGGRWSVPLSR